MASRMVFLTGSSWLSLRFLRREPVRIGVTTILSGHYADRGQSEQYGVELALQRINEAGGVLGRPVEALLRRQRCGSRDRHAATKRLIEEQHVPVLLGALATPVTHAIMPIVAEAKCLSSSTFPPARTSSTRPVSAATTMPSRRSRPTATSRSRLMGWLKGRGVAQRRDRQRRQSIQPRQRGQHGEGRGGGRHQGSRQRDDRQGHEGPCAVDGAAEGACADQVVTLLSASTAPFFRAYEQSGWKVPITGRIDVSAAMGAVSPEFLASGGLDGATSITVFNPMIETPGVRDFVQAYGSEIRDHANPALLLRL